MRIVIMGSGRFGATLANRLSKEGHDVRIIDILSEPFRKYLDADFTGRMILGDGIDQDVLRTAGIEGADAFVAAAHGDNHNLMAAQIAKIIFGVKRVVARSNDPVRREIFEELGLVTVCPSLIGAGALYEAVMNEAWHQRDVDAAITEMLIR